MKRPNPRGPEGLFVLLLTITSGAVAQGPAVAEPPPPEASAAPADAALPNTAEVAVEVAPVETTPPAAPSSPATAAEPEPTPAPIVSRTATPLPPAPPSKILYTVERVEVRGNRTQASVIRSFVPLSAGDTLDVDDPAIEQVRFRLMGTGWFDDVRLTLERGRQRGWVVLVVEVEERNTLQVSRIVAGLSRVVTSSRKRENSNDPLRPYGGLGLRESNLFGTGIGLAGSAVVSELQFGVDLRYADPVALGKNYDLTGRAFYNHAREFFGREPLFVTIHCPEPDPDSPDEECDQDVLRRRAVVIYDRAGLGIGTGNELGPSLRYELDWLGEKVDVEAKPTAASTTRGQADDQRAPIDFHIDDGVSYVSSLHTALIYDTRDHPALPARGQLLRLDARIGAGILGSSYDFARFEASFRHFQRLPWKHVLSLGAFAGTVVGRAPFFYHFYAADLSDLLPSRVLELNLDHRRTHNLLNTSIQEHNKEEIAARLDFEYQLPLQRGGGDVRGIDAYLGAGLFMLSSREALRVGVPGYDGLSRVPVDLTFDLGVQADTTVGLFKVGFSSLIGFLPDLGQQQ